MVAEDVVGDSVEGEAVGVGAIELHPPALERSRQEGEGEQVSGVTHYRASGLKGGQVEGLRTPDFRAKLSMEEGSDGLGGEGEVGGNEGNEVGGVQRGRTIVSKTIREFILA